MSRRPFSLRSVRTRLTLWNIGVLALVLAVLGVSLRLRMQYMGIAQIDRQLAVDRDRTQAQLDAPPPPPPGEGDGPPDGGDDRPPPPQFLDPGPPRGPQGTPPDPDTFGPNGVYHPRRFDLSGQPIFDPPGQTKPSRIWDRGAFAQTARGREVTVNTKNGTDPVRVLSIPLRQNGRIIGVGQYAASLAALQGEVSRLTRTLLTLIPLALLVAGFGGAFLTDRALRPVRRITQTAGHIEASDLSGRLPVTGSDEFTDLAETFNGMLARLEQAFEQQRRFTADASHELRTPLTIIKANTSLALLGDCTPEDYRQALAAIDRAADRTTRLVQDLLLLARADAGKDPRIREVILLSELLARAVEMATAPDQAVIQLCLPESPLSLCGDADALRRLFTNLLENAARHTLPSGTIRLSAEHRAGTVTVSVADTGEGIAPEHLPHVFERFYRVDAARTGGRGGTGLGLAICRTIADAHDGSIALESTPGSGTIVRVTLPAA